MIAMLLCCTVITELFSGKVFIMNILLTFCLDSFVYVFVYTTHMTFIIQK